LQSHFTRFIGGLKALRQALLRVRQSVSVTHEFIFADSGAVPLNRRRRCGGPIPVVFGTAGQAIHALG